LSAAGRLFGRGAPPLEIQPQPEEHAMGFISFIESPDPICPGEAPRLPKLS
jgi:hypothetical protein